MNGVGRRRDIRRERQQQGDRASSLRMWPKSVCLRGRGSEECFVPECATAFADGKECLPIKGSAAAWWLTESRDDLWLRETAERRAAYRKLPAPAAETGPEGNGSRSFSFR
jgi:hypothetical protein